MTHFFSTPLQAHLLIAGLEDKQSALVPASVETDRFAPITWILLGGGTLIFALVMILVGLALFGSLTVRRWLQAESTVLAGGVAFPTIVLSVLLVYASIVTASGTREHPQLHIKIVGEQWWWRVIYQPGNSLSVETANEIRLPADRAVRLTLQSADVIHSFWVPRLAGKIDLIPGRTNTLTIKATKPGRFRGQCAEYCGGAHALMSFHVTVLQPTAFDEWLNNEAQVARPPVSPSEVSGKAVFQARGCGGCHTIRGTEARGRIGPDLTHIGNRKTIAASTLPNNATALVRWVRDSQAIKPGNKMLPYKTMNQSDLRAIAAYLESLE